MKLLVMPLSSSHYFIVNVPFVHLLPEYSPQPDISLPHEDDPKFLACVLSENLLQFDFEAFPHQFTGDEYINYFK
jgi:hypothetical protein